MKKVLCGVLAVMFIFSVCAQAGYAKMNPIYQNNKPKNAQEIGFNKITSAQQGYTREQFDVVVDKNTLELKDLGSINMDVVMPSGAQLDENLQRSTTLAKDIHIDHRSGKIYKNANMSEGIKRKLVGGVKQYKSTDEKFAQLKQALSTKCPGFFKANGKDIKSIGIGKIQGRQAFAFVTADTAPGVKTTTILGNVQLAEEAIGVKDEQLVEAGVQKGETAQSTKSDGNWLTKAINAVVSFFSNLFSSKSPIETEGADTSSLTGNKTTETNTVTVNKNEAEKIAQKRQEAARQRKEAEEKANAAYIPSSSSDTGFVALTTPKEKQYKRSLYHAEHDLRGNDHENIRAFDKALTDEAKNLEGDVYPMHTTWVVGKDENPKDVINQAVETRKKDLQEIAGTNYEQTRAKIQGIQKQSDALTREIRTLTNLKTNFSQLQQKIVQSNASINDLASTYQAIHSYMKGDVTNPRNSTINAALSSIANRLNDVRVKLEGQDVKAEQSLKQAKLPQDLGSAIKSLGSKIKGMEQEQGKLGGKKRKIESAYRMLQTDLMRDGIQTTTIE